MKNVFARLSRIVSRHPHKGGSTVVWWSIGGQVVAAEIMCVFMEINGVRALSVFEIIRSFTVANNQRESWCGDDGSSIFHLMFSFRF